MPAPNLFLIYVRNAEAATAFYRDLFEIEPVFTSPRYVAFEVAPGVLFAVWTGHREHAVPSTPRTCEVGLMVPGSAAAVDDTFTRWISKGVKVVEEPYDDVFGRTFVITDPTAISSVSPRWTDLHEYPPNTLVLEGPRRHMVRRPFDPPTSSDMHRERCLLRSTV